MSFQVSIHFEPGETAPGAGEWDLGGVRERRMEGMWSGKGLDLSRDTVTWTQLWWGTLEKTEPREEGRGS